MSRDKTSVWVIILRSMLGNIFAEKSIEREGKIRQNNALSLPGVGGNPEKFHTTVKSSKTYILHRGPLYFQNS
jgi:maltooligosyltrehalose synthase